MTAPIPDKLAAIKTRSSSYETLAWADINELIAEVERLRDIFTQLQFRIAKQDEDEELLTLIDAAFDPERSAL